MVLSIVTLRIYSSSNSHWRTLKSTGIVMIEIGMEHMMGNGNTAKHFVSH
jgi:hypothetical protein